MTGCLMGEGPLDNGARESLRWALELKSEKEPAVQVGQPVQRPCGAQLALPCTKEQVSVTGGRAVVAPSTVLGSLSVARTPGAFACSPPSVLRQILQLCTFSDAVT